MDDLVDLQALEQLAAGTREQRHHTTQVLMYRRHLVRFRHGRDQMFVLLRATAPAMANETAARVTIKHLETLRPGELA